MHFERLARRVIYVPDGEGKEEKACYLATNGKVGAPERKPLDPARRRVGIAAALTYWTNVDKREHCFACARTIAESYALGDRWLLDTEEAKKAAEIVCSLVRNPPESMDVCAALIDLSDEIAKVRLAKTQPEDFEVFEILQEAAAKCREIEGYESWNAHARQRRFVYVIPRAGRTEVVKTLVGLMFGIGDTDLVTTHQRHELLNLPKMGTDIDSLVRYASDCISKITEYRFL